jgi:hypothetical protein
MRLPAAFDHANRAKGFVRDTATLGEARLPR